VTTDELSIVVLVCGAVALLNLLMQPLVAKLSYAFTVFTLGLILLMINAAFIKLASLFIDGFSIEGWTTAFLFSLIVTSVLILSDRLLLRKSY
jgi:putative membrane protein